MSETEQRRGRPGYDRAGILAVAVAAFNEHGYDATSIAMLAERLGLSKSAVYHHFASKEAMLEAALDDALGGLEAVLAEPGGFAGPPAERLRHVVLGAVHVLVDRLPQVTLLLRLRGNTVVEREALRRRRAFDKAMQALVRDAQEAGDVRADVDPRILERLLFGMVNSIVDWYRPGGEEGAEQLAADVLAVAFDGIWVR